MQTRREIIKGGLGLAGIIAAGKAPASLVRSLIAARSALTGGRRRSPSYWGLCFTAEGSGATISMSAVGTPPTLHLYTSKDAINWTGFIPGTDSIILANVGDKVWFKGGTLSDNNRNNATGTNSSNYWKFTIDNAFVVASGDLRSLMDGDNGYELSLGAYAFNRLFLGCLNLTEPPDLLATTITGANPYQAIFQSSGIRRIANMPQSIALSGVFGAQMYSLCENLVEVDMSGTIFSGTLDATGLGTGLFMLTSNLKYIKPALISIGSNTFYNCASLEIIDFRHATSVIALGSTSVFSGVYSAYKVVVPDSLYSRWRTSTNWKNTGIIGHIVKASDYVEA